MSYQTINGRLQWKSENAAVGCIFDTRLCCDGRIHYYPCVRAGCNEREYFCKHTSDDDRHCPRNAQRRGEKHDKR